MDKSLSAVKVYDKIAEKYTEIFFKDFSDKTELNLFLSYLPHGAKILDVGCGPGNITQYFLQKGFDCEGIDLSQGMIKMAKKRVPEGNFKVADLRKLDYPENSFDALIAAYSFMHIPQQDTRKTLKGFKRILKPRGIFFLIVKEGKGERFLKEPLDSSEKCYVKLWQIPEALRLLRDLHFDILYEGRGKSITKGELRYDKIFILARNRKGETI